MRKLIEQDLHDLQVVSYQELTPDVNIQPLARIDL
jgi:type III secretion protein V